MAVAVLSGIAFIACFVCFVVLTIDCCRLTCWRPKTLVDDSFRPNSPSDDSTERYSPQVGQILPRLPAVKRQPLQVIEEGVSVTELRVTGQTVPINTKRPVARLQNSPPPLPVPEWFGELDDLQHFEDGSLRRLPPVARRMAEQMNAHRPPAPATALHHRPSLPIVIRNKPALTQF